MAFKVGDILLKKYRLDAFLGLGGFSEVWKCHDLEAGQDLAVKIFLKQDDQGVKLCKDEYAKMSKLRHPHILRPSFFTAEDGIAYFFMPYCEQGTALAQMGKLDEIGIAKLIYQIGSALEYIHNRPQPILHNDLKPDNFLIEDTGDYQLTDFGISDQLNQRLVQEQDEERRTLVKAEEERKGVTPKAYRPPELFKKKNEPDMSPVKASDIWSFGASIYQLIMGEPPFDKEGGGQQKVYYNVNPQTNLNDIIEALPEDYSKSLDLLIKRCLAFHPWDRPAAQELAQAAGLFLKKGIWEERPEAPSEFYVSDNAIRFGKVQLNENAVRTLDFTTANMSGRLSINVTHPFAISLDGNNMSSRLSVELRPEREQRPLYIHFSPPDSNQMQGVVSFMGEGLGKHRIELSGQGKIQRRLPLWMKVGAGVAGLSILVFIAFPKGQSVPENTTQTINFVDTIKQKTSTSDNTQKTLDLSPKKESPKIPVARKHNHDKPELKELPKKPPPQPPVDSRIENLEKKKKEQYKENSQKR